MNSTAKTVVFWVLIVVSAILLWQLVVRAGGAGLPESEIDFSAFLNHVDQGNVKEVTITGTDVRGTYKDGTALFRTTVPPNYPDMITLLRQKGVTIKVKDNQGGTWSGWPGPSSRIRISRGSGRRGPRTRCGSASSARSAKRRTSVTGW